VIGSSTIILPIIRDARTPFTDRLRLGRFAVHSEAADRRSYLLQFQYARLPCSSFLTPITPKIAAVMAVMTARKEGRANCLRERLGVARFSPLRIGTVRLQPNKDLRGLRGIGR
jgi:hypothetical protein